MTATVKARTAAAMITRRHTWRTGDSSVWASRTPVCSVSGPTASNFTRGTVMSGVPPCAPPHPFGSGDPTDLLAFLGGQFPLELLPRGRDGDRVDEDDVPQPLVRSHLVVDRRNHRLGRQGGAVVVGLADDVGDGQLAGLLVRASDHRRAGHPRDAEQDLLELAREDVVALVEQHVLGAVDDREVAVLVEDSDVAGVEPAAGVDRLGGRVGAVGVAAHDLRTADADLPALPG